MVIKIENFEDYVEFSIFQERHLRTSMLKLTNPSALEDGEFNDEMDRNMADAIRYALNQLPQNLREGMIKTLKRISDETIILMQTDSASTRVTDFPEFTEEETILGKEVSEYVTKYCAEYLSPKLGIPVDELEDSSRDFVKGLTEEGKRIQSGMDVVESLIQD
jgi:hypothetical protein